MRRTCGFARCSLWQWRAFFRAVVMFGLLFYFRENMRSINDNKISTCHALCKGLFVTSFFWRDAGFFHPRTPSHRILQICNECFCLLERPQVVPICDLPVFSMYWNNSYINVRNVRIQDCWGAHFVLVWSFSLRQPFPFLIPHFPRPSPTLSSFMVVLCIFTRRSRLIKGGSTSHTGKKMSNYIFIGFVLVASLVVKLTKID